MRWLVVLVVCAGCRQLLGIDEGAVIEDAAVPLDDLVLPDGDAASLGHDEDGDGVADTADNCPTIGNSNQAANPSSEAVGTSCDPRTGGPASSGDRIAAFFSFAEAGRPADIQGGDVFQSDRATLGGGELATETQYTPTRISIIVSSLPLLAGNASLELRLGTHNCRIGGCASSGLRCLRASSPNAVGETEAVVISPFRLEMDQREGSILCRVVHSMVETTAMADAADVETDKPRIRANGGTADIDSFIVYDVAP